MPELNPFINSNATFPFTDLSLAGRVPPPYTPNGAADLLFGVDSVQLRPNLINPRKLVENRKYSDNPTQPYVSTYDYFEIPLTFTLDFFDLASDTPQNPTLITSITAKLLSCRLESPLPKDGKQRTDVKNGKAVAAPAKFATVGQVIWSPGNFKEPFIFGSGFPGKMDLPTGTTMSYGPGVEEADFKVFGYFTERNFFDREWITKWGPLSVKCDAFGAYLQNPLKPLLNPLDIRLVDWIRIAAWTPDQFYQENIGLASKIDANIIQRYINRCTNVVSYKPSEISSLRYYFLFTATTNKLLSKSTYGCLTVKYNQDLGDKRLKLALERQNPKQITCPFTNEVDFQLE
jgi:hypothetical protein